MNEEMKTSEKRVWKFARNNFSSSEKQNNDLEGFDTNKIHMKAHITMNYYNGG